MMSKHKHYEIGVAKLANTDLVVFFKDGDDWFFDDTSESYNFRSDIEYFLCLPQHKEACLHWLNGGEVQAFFEGDWVNCISLSKSANVLKFTHYHMFMDDGLEFRIKPKKVKRWIAYGTNSQKMGVRTFSSKCECVDQYGDEVLNGPIQYFEIEVEE